LFPRSEKKRILLIAAGAVLALAVIALYALVDPGAALFPRCPLKALTGFDCPGCGSQRAFHALLRGDIAGAWRYNAALFFAAPVIVLYFVSSGCRGRYPRLYAALNSPVAIAVIAVATAVWWVLRNH
jgi:hypothetical protein